MSAGALTQQDPFGPESSHDRVSQDHTGGYTGPSAVGQQNLFNSREDAEAAFSALLRSKNVTDKFTWEQMVMAVVAEFRVTYKKPSGEPVQFGAANRKAAFEQYVLDFRVQAEQLEQQRAAQFRLDFLGLLSRFPEIKHYSRWQTWRPRLQSEPVFARAKDDAERESVFEEYAEERWQEFCRQEAEARENAKKELYQIFASSDYDLETTWEQVEGDLRANPSAEDAIQRLTIEEMIIEWNKYYEELEKLEEQMEKEEEKQRLRQERKNRQAFEAQLEQLKLEGHISDCKTTLWEDIYPFIKDAAIWDNDPDDFPHAMDMFRFFVYETEQELQPKRSIATEALRKLGFGFDSSTTLADFKKELDQDERTALFENWEVMAIFKIFRRKVTEEATKELLYRIKRLRPSVRHTDTWESVAPNLRYEGYEDLDDETRREIFEQYKRELREGSGLSDRSADRDQRNGHTRPRSANGPVEVNAYEAERKRLGEDRERRARRADSPGRYRDDRDRYNDRDGGRMPSTDYFFRRRDSRDRDRSHGDRSRASRADPRDKPVDLSYEDEPVREEQDRRPVRRFYSDSWIYTNRSQTSRGHRDERRRWHPYEDTRSDAARSRVSRVTTPETTATERAVRSGSEEGEIEEI